MQSVPILYFIAMFAHSVLLQEHALRTFVPDPCHTGERERELRAAFTQIFPRKKETV